MDEEMTNWSQLYQQQEISMTTLTIELARIRGRDRRRYTIEGLALLLVVGAAIYYLTLGTVTTVISGIGLLLFAAASVGYAVLRVGGIEGASFAAPKDYVSELEARNDREIRRVSPTWPLWAVGGLCATVDIVALIVEWDAYAAAPWVMPLAVLAEAVILGGVVLWRRRELRRLETERAAIVELRAQIL